MNRKKTKSLITRKPFGFTFPWFSALLRHLRHCRARLGAFRCPKNLERQIMLRRSASLGRAHAEVHLHFDVDDLGDSDALCDAMSMSMSCVQYVLH